MTTNTTPSVSQLVNGERQFSDRAEGMLASVLAVVPAASRQQAERLLRATAAGDAIGATVEFMSPREAAAAIRKHSAAGYPYVPVGGGPFHWQPGDVTDDTEMALRVAAACSSCEQPTLATFGNEYVAWMATNPRDVGNQTRRTIMAMRGGASPADSGWLDYQRSPQACGNGGLMRNGCVAAFATSLEEVWRLSVLQSIPTHYHPSSVVCCAVHGALVWTKLKHGTPRKPVDLLAIDVLEKLRPWFTSCEDAEVQQWQTRVGEKAIKAAIGEVTHATNDLKDFDPFRRDLLSTQGWAVLSLQMALWVALVSSGDKKLKPADLIHCDLDAICSKCRGFDALAILALCGADSDTYGAIGAPLMI